MWFSKKQNPSPSTAPKPSTNIPLPTTSNNNSISISPIITQFTKKLKSTIKSPPKPTIEQILSELPPSKSPSHSTISPLYSIFTFKPSKNSNLDLMDQLLQTLFPIIHTLTISSTKIISQILSLIYPLANKLFTNHPDLSSLVLILLTIYTTLITVRWITRIIYTITRNLIKLGFFVGLAVVVLNYYNRHMKETEGPDGIQMQSFDWQGTLQDLQGFWGLVKNVGGILMDLMEAGSNLDQDGWNSERRKVVGRDTGEGLWSEGNRRNMGRNGRYNPRQ